MDQYNYPQGVRSVRLPPRVVRFEPQQQFRSTRALQIDRSSFVASNAPPPSSFRFVENSVPVAVAVTGSYRGGPMMTSSIPPSANSSTFSSPARVLFDSNNNSFLANNQNNINNISNSSIVFPRTYDPVAGSNASSAVKLAAAAASSAFLAGSATSSPPRQVQLFSQSSNTAATAALSTSSSSVGAAVVAPPPPAAVAKSHPSPPHGQPHYLAPQAKSSPPPPPAVSSSPPQQQHQQQYHHQSSPHHQRQVVPPSHEPFTASMAPHWQDEQRFQQQQQQQQYQQPQPQYSSSVPDRSLRGSHVNYPMQLSNPSSLLPSNQQQKPASPPLSTAHLSGRNLFGNNTNNINNNSYNNGNDNSALQASGATLRGNFASHHIPPTAATQSSYFTERGTAYPTTSRNNNYNPVSSFDEARYTPLRFAVSTSSLTAAAAAAAAPPPSSSSGINASFALSSSAVFGGNNNNSSSSYSRPYLPSSSVIAPPLVPPYSSASTSSPFSLSASQLSGRFRLGGGKGGSPVSPPVLLEGKSEGDKQFLSPNPLVQKYLSMPSSSGQNHYYKREEKPYFATNSWFDRR